MAIDPFLGEITLFAGTYAPKGWAFCDGQILKIAEYMPLYSIVGARYGGDGKTTFALPDFRGRLALGRGTHQEEGKPAREFKLGQSGGRPSARLTADNLPSHNHKVQVVGGAEASDEINSAYRIFATGAGKAYGARKDAFVRSAPNTRPSHGLPVPDPVRVMNPTLGLSFIIATEGVWPAR